MQVVGCRVQFIVVMRRKENREVPLETIAHTFRAMSHWIVRPYIDGARKARFMIHTLQESIIATSENNICILRMDCHMSTLATCRTFPVLLTYRTAACTVRNA